MTERPPAERVDLWLDAFSIGHEAIFGFHRALVADDRANDHSRSLLAESADIALRSGPALTKEARRLLRIWDEQSLLAPEIAPAARSALDRELARIEPEIRLLQRRHRAIARELVALLDEER